MHNNNVPSLGLEQQHEELQHPEGLCRTKLLTLFCVILSWWLSFCRPRSWATTTLHREPDMHRCPDRAFAAAGPGLWNSLPPHLRDADLPYSRFWQSLKTFLFGQWGYGAVRTILTAPSRNNLTCSESIQHPTSVRSHLLLCNEHLLGAVDDKVAAGIQRTLIQFREIAVSETTQQTVRRSQHYWDLANECLLVLCLHWCLSLADNGFGYVNVEWCGIATY